MDCKWTVKPIRVFACEVSHLCLASSVQSAHGLRLSLNDLATLMHIQGMIPAVDLCSTLVQFEDTNTLLPQPAARSAPAPAAAPSTPMELGSTKSEQDVRPAEPVDAKETSSSVALPDYGPVPDEPVDDANSVKISLKLPNKTIARRYLKSDLVRSLFAVAVANCPECSTRKFELFTRYPVLNLADHLNSTVEQSALANSQVAHRWI